MDASVIPQQTNHNIDMGNIVERESNSRKT